MAPKGFIPEGFGLKANDAAAQFIAMAKTWDYGRMDFVGESRSIAKLFI
jgi:hypothetical protein